MNLRPRRPAPVNIALTILLLAAIGGTFQSYWINQRADRVAINVDQLSGATNTLSAAVGTLADTVAALNSRVLDCLDPDGECKSANDAATAAAVANIVESFNRDLDAALAQIQADLENLRLDRRIDRTPIPPPPPGTTTTTTTQPAAAAPANTPPITTAGICLPLGLLTVGCGP